MDINALTKLIYSFSLPILLFSENIPFQIGEILHYQASFAKVNAAVAQLKVIGLDTVENTPVYHVQFSAKTKGIMNYVFPIEDQIELWIDKKSLLPIRIRSNISEGKFRKQDHIFIPKNSNYLISNNDTININEPIHSPYSLFYYIRKSNFSLNKKNFIYTIDSKKIRYLELKINDTVNVNVPAGEFNCFEVTPVSFDNKKFQNNAEMSMLFSKDNYRYPVKIWLNLKYGSLILELDEITN